jgi:hypothetical protein
MVVLFGLLSVIFVSPLLMQIHFIDKRVKIAVSMAASNRGEQVLHIL